MTTTPKTHVPYCIHLDGCDRDAVEMVGPLSLCAEHAEQERVERERDARRIAKIMATPEMQAEIARENALEARVS